MLDQEIPTRWVIIIFSGLAACVLFVWWLIAWPGSGGYMYAQCMKAQFDTDGSDKKEVCHAGVAYRIAWEAAKAACASQESSKIQKCELVPDSDVANAAETTVTITNGSIRRGTDVKLTVYLRYRDDRNEPHPAYYTVRLTRSSADDPNWQIAKSEFSAR